MKTYITSFFLLPLFLFFFHVPVAFTAVDDIVFNDPDGAYGAEFCYIYDNPVSYTLTYTGANPDQLHPDWDSPSVSGGNATIAPTASPFVSSFNWSDYSADAVPVPTDGNPTHISQFRVRQSTYQVAGLQTFYVTTEADCGGGGGGTATTTTVDAESYTNMFAYGFGLFLLSFYLARKI